MLNYLEMHTCTHRPIYHAKCYSLFREREEEEEEKRRREIEEYMREREFTMNETETERLTLMSLSAHGQMYVLPCSKN